MEYGLFYNTRKLTEMAQEFTPKYTFKEDRLNELKHLFPEAWEDGVFNVDTLKELIGEFSTDNTVKEHFGLNWVGKQDARRIAAKPPTGTLKPCIGEGVNEDTTENIFIEGENLEVLKILRKSYLGKIKMIYIDPPYNTGNDFIYNDTFADSTEDYLRKTGEKSDEGLLVSNPKSSGKYHANWLSFMYPRLRLAKDLLKDDGVIFISIDDNEYDNLKKVCDEIYGEENFIGMFIVNSSPSAIDYGHIGKTHDYCFFYAKNIGQATTKHLEEKDKVFKYKDKVGPFNIYPLYNGNVAFNPQTRPNLFYSFYLNPNKKILNDFYEIGLEEKEGWVKVNPVISKKDGIQRVWRWGKPKSLENLNNEIVGYKTDSGEYRVVQKSRLTGKVIRSLQLDTEISSRKGTAELEQLFGKKIFPYPKPTELIRRFISISTEKDDIILDFFSGSGSTGHSVLRINNEQYSNRKFIIVQLSEKCNVDNYKNISEIGKDRLRKVLNNYNSNQGFKVYKQFNSTIYKWQEFVPEQDGALPDLFSKMELAYKNPLQDGVTTQDFITEVILQEGFPLTAKQEEVASGIFKITHDWVPYTLYATMLYSFKNTDFKTLPLEETDHFVCLDKAFDGNDALKQSLDNTCKLYTI